MKIGVSREEAEAFVDFSDMANVRLCLEKTLPADLRLHIGAYDFITEHFRMRRNESRIQFLP